MGWCCSGIGGAVGEGGGNGGELVAAMAASTATAGGGYAGGGTVTAGKAVGEARRLWKHGANTAVRMDAAGGPIGTFDMETKGR